MIARALVAALAAVALLAGDRERRGHAAGAGLRHAARSGRSGRRRTSPRRWATRSSGASPSPATRTPSHARRLARRRPAARPTQLGASYLTPTATAVVDPAGTYQFYCWIHGGLAPGGDERHGRGRRRPTRARPWTRARRGPTPTGRTRTTRTTGRAAAQRHDQPPTVFEEGDNTPPPLELLKVTPTEKGAKVKVEVSEAGTLTLRLKLGKRVVATKRVRDRGRQEHGDDQAAEAPAGPPAPLPPAGVGDGRRRPGLRDPLHLGRSSGRERAVTASPPDRWAHGSDARSDDGIRGPVGESSRRRACTPPATLARDFGRRHTRRRLGATLGSTSPGAAAILDDPLEPSYGAQGRTTGYRGSRSACPTDDLLGLRGRPAHARRATSIVGVGRAGRRRQRRRRPSAATAGRSRASANSRPTSGRFAIAHGTARRTRPSNPASRSCRPATTASSEHRSAARSARRGPGALSRGDRRPRAQVALYAERNDAAPWSARRRSSRAADRVQLETTARRSTAGVAGVAARDDPSGDHARASGSSRPHCAFDQAPDLGPHVQQLREEREIQRLRRKPTPEEPPVPRLWPMIRSTVFMCRKRQSWKLSSTSTSSSHIS